MTSHDLLIKEIAELLNLSTEDYSYQQLKRIKEQLLKVPYIQYPVALHTVDMIPYRFAKTGIEILLGRKNFRTQFQFLGGFVDPKDSAEMAAVRELKEETSDTIIVKEKDLEYLGSFFIDDYRYRNSCHKVSTSLFMVAIESNKKVKPGDDIEEVKWFNVENLNEENLISEHKQLLDFFLTEINKEQSEFE